MAVPAEDEAESVTQSTDGDLRDDQENALEQAISDLQGTVDRDKDAATGGLSRTLREIPLEVQAVIGRAELSVAELNRLEGGSTIPLDSRVGDPVDIFVNGVKVATGQMQLSQEEPDRFAFKVTNVCS